MKEYKLGSLGRFIEHFKYAPNSPSSLFYDKYEYSRLLDKCVADDFDYTIQLYGTNPNYGTRPNDGVCID